MAQRDVPAHEWPLDPESVGDIEALSFWTALTTPDAWQLDGARLAHLG